MKKLILIFLLSTSVANSTPPVGIGNQGLVPNYSNNTVLPYNQATKLAGVNTLVETGNENMLADPGMESPGVTAWTCTGGTCTKTSTAGEFTSGSQALKVALSAQALNVSQSINTTSGIQAQGAIGISYKVPSAITDFQVCSLVAGVEQRCFPSSMLINDNLYHSIEIPVLFTGGSTAGIKLKTTATYTQNVFFDAAYIKQGISVSGLNLDRDYSAQSAIAGTVSGETVDWINGNCTNAAPSVCTFNTGIFNNTPNCIVNELGNASHMCSVLSLSNTSVSFRCYNDAGVDNTTAVAKTLFCQKSGSDYTAASGFAYGQFNSNTTWTPCTFSTLAWSGLGTVTNNLQCQRNGSMLEMKGSVVLGTVAASLAQFPLPNNWGSLTTQSSSANDSYGEIWRDAATVASKVNAISTSGLGYFQVSNSLISSANNPITASNGSTSFATGDTLTFVNIRIPIQGWSNAGYIVGSFQNYNYTPGIVAPKIFSASITTTSGAVANNKGSIITSCTAANPTVCTMVGLSSTPNCEATIEGGAGVGASITTTSSSVSITSFTTSTGAALASQVVRILCHGD